MAATAWENSAIAHARLFEEMCMNNTPLTFNIPEFNFDHLKRMTTGFGIIQFSKLNEPDIESGYTLDDNARAMIAMCERFELTRGFKDMECIAIYLNFIAFCQQYNGNFLNYVDENAIFTAQNDATNLADANGRAVWALGHLISKRAILPNEMAEQAESILQKALVNVHKIHSTRAMAFVIKGLYYYNSDGHSDENINLIRELADRMVQMYRHEADGEWQWFEGYLTYGNSVLPEAMLCAWLATGELIYKDIAHSSFNFLLSKTFRKSQMKVIDNNNWLYKGNSQVKLKKGGEQPIEIAYTMMALKKFYDVFKNVTYLDKMKIAFNWFLGNNHLNQIIYNPSTGGCYDGLEENYVNLNQGAESTISYLLARLTIEQTLKSKQKIKLKNEPVLV